MKYLTAIVITLITTLLYCISTAYTHGYLFILDLASDPLERTFHQVIYHGMILLMNSRWLIWLIMLLPLCILLFFAYKCVASEYIKKFSRARKFVNLKKTLRFSTKKNTYTPAEKIIIGNMKISILPFFAFVIFATIMRGFEIKGQNYANQVLESINDRTYKIIYSNKKSIPLAFLYCGSKVCAGFNISTGKVEYFSSTHYQYNGHSIKERLSIIKAK